MSFSFITDAPRRSCRNSRLAVESNRAHAATGPDFQKLMQPNRIHIDSKQVGASRKFTAIRQSEIWPSLAWCDVQLCASIHRRVVAVAGRMSTQAGWL